MREGYADFPAPDGDLLADGFSDLSAVIDGQFRPAVIEGICFGEHVGF